MATDEVKNQHYVPRLYLRYFTNTEDRLFAYDKVTGRRFKATVEGIANVAFFYDLPLDTRVKTSTGNRNQIVEKTLAVIEGDFAEALRALHKEIASGKITGVTKQRLVPFLALQLMRTRETRTEMVELHESMLRVISEVEAENARILGQKIRLVPGRIANEDQPVIHAQAMFDPAMVGAICEALTNHIWMIGYNRTSRPLYTSDHPIAKHSHSFHPFMSMSGVNSPGIEIVFPLSSTYVLSMVHRKSFLGIEKDENQVYELIEENVIFFNDLQVSSSYRQIYCVEDDFDLAEEICQQRTYLRNPKRARIQVNNGGQIFGAGVPETGEDVSDQ